MNEFIALPKVRCFNLFHKWETKYIKDGNVYRQCKKCGARKVLHNVDRGGEVRYNWLSGKTNIVKSSPKKEKDD